jgi:DNA-binding CsgD family transcriptional regulator
MFEPITTAALIVLGLSPREAEVLVWVARGKSNAEIAAALQISTPTVKKHAERIFRKLGVKCRMAAAVTAAERCAALGIPNGSRRLNPSQGDDGRALQSSRGKQAV